MRAVHTRMSAGCKPQVAEGASKVARGDRGVARVGDRVGSGVGDVGTEAMAGRSQPWLLRGMAGAGRRHDGCAHADERGLQASGGEIGGGGRGRRQSDRLMLAPARSSECKGWSEREVAHRQQRRLLRRRAGGGDQWRCAGDVGHAWR